MTDIDTDVARAPVRLAYWSGTFTVLSMQLLRKRYFSMRVWRLVLYCNGQYIVAALHELRIPGDWWPQLGETVNAKLKLGNRPGTSQLHVQHIEPA